MGIVHTPVLKEEVINFLAVKPGKKYIDTTVGGGGHAEAILESGGEVLGIDFDPQALEIATRRLASACPPDVQAHGHLAHGNFADLKKIAQRENFYPASGILFDLGISSFQLEDPSRGFSFATDSVLDMRMNTDSQKVTARDLINALNEGELYELFIKLGEEHRARRFSRAICRARRIKPIITGQDLTKIILGTLTGKERYARIPARWAGRHPATNVFRALRMAVNDELVTLASALPQALQILEKNGRLVVISFHSLEDRIVKNFMTSKENEGLLMILTRKPVVPKEEEIASNPRARSAKMRVGEKL